MTEYKIVPSGVSGSTGLETRKILQAACRDDNMKRLAWLTDIHLNFLDSRRVKEFCRSVAGHDPDAVLISGDIGDASTIKIYLWILEDEIGRPIYFVLGNHDFYHGSIAGVREAIQELSDRSDHLHWLPSISVVRLTEETCLIGIDSWADGRLGNYEKSHVMLNDYNLIKELTGLDQNARRVKLNELGDSAAAELRDILPEALDRFRHVILLTHVPPFKEACWHKGALSNDDWLPHLGCKVVGETLIEFMRRYGDREMTVLCGHTHSAGSDRILPNLSVKTGGAVYGSPRLQELLIVK